MTDPEEDRPLSLRQLAMLEEICQVQAEARPEGAILESCDLRNELIDILETLERDACRKSNGA